MLRRTPLRRRTPLKAVSALRRAVAKVRRPRDTGPDRATRLKVALRSEGLCERCGAELATQVHHRNPRRMGSRRGPWVNGLPNLGHLGNLCHAWVESNRTAALVEGWLLRANENPATVPVLTRHGLAFFDDKGGWRFA